MALRRRASGVWRVARRALDGSSKSLPLTQVGGVFGLNR